MTEHNDTKRVEHSLQHAGLVLDDQEKQELAAAYAAVAKMVARLRTPRTPMAELAHCFKASESS
ncbi:MAG: hypothetical protein ACI9DC_003353 [Gammaproteobacteria bacterium]|jgi:hypothetical protein